MLISRLPLRTRLAPLFPLFAARLFSSSPSPNPNSSSHLPDHDHDPLHPDAVQERLIHQAEEGEKPAPKKIDQETLHFESTATNNNTSLNASPRFVSQEKPDGIKFLLGEHQRLRALFSDIQSTTDWSAKCRLVHEMVSETTVHSSTEQRYLYPLIQSKLPEDELLFERMHMDNRITKEMLGFLEKCKPSSADDRILFDMTINKLVASEIDHMENEEQLLFKNLAEKLTEEEKGQLENDLRWGKSNAPTHPTDLPSFAPKITHPIAGIVEKLFESASSPASECDTKQAPQQQQQQKKSKTSSQSSGSQVSEGKEKKKATVPPSTPRNVQY